MIKDLLIAAMAIVITWLAASWLFCFTCILLNGSVLLQEPITWILTAEFALALLITMAGLLVAVLHMVKLLRDIRRDK